MSPTIEHHYFCNSPYLARRMIKVRGVLPVPEWTDSRREVETSPSRMNGCLRFFIPSLSRILPHIDRHLPRSPGNESRHWLENGSSSNGKQHAGIRLSMASDTVPKSSLFEQPRNGWADHTLSTGSETAAH